HPGARSRRHGLRSGRHRDDLAPRPRLQGALGARRADGPKVLTRRNTGNDHDCFCARPTVIPMLNLRRDATGRKEVVEMRVLKVGDGTMIQPQPEVATSTESEPVDVAPSHPLVLVRWQDAWFDADQQDAEDWRNDYLVQTVGFVVRQEPDLVSVAQELLP